MPTDPLRAILDDLAGDDSALMAQFAAELRAHGSVEVARARAEAGVVFAFLRQVRAIVGELLGSGMDPATVRREMLGVVDGPADNVEHRARFRAAVVRALDELIGLGDAPS